MSDRITNLVLFERCKRCTGDAHALLAALSAGGSCRVGYAPEDAELAVNAAKLRNLLREAHCAAQELKTRLKSEIRNSKSKTGNDQGKDHEQ
jgi:hypothetical protein